MSPLIHVLLRDRTNALLARAKFGSDVDWPLEPIQRRLLSG